MNNKVTYKKSTSPKQFQDNTNLYSIFRSLKRNKKISSAFLIVILFISALYTFFSKPKWRGEFQIVLELNEVTIGNTALSRLRALGIGEQKSSLKTEVSILKSSSVLKPTFNYVKEKKKEKGNDISNLYYKDWLKEFFKIELDPGTSVLNISYTDTDKDLIKPVLESISKAYQIYSGQKREKQLSNAIIFLRNEIKKADKTSQESMKLLQSFSLKYKLGNSDGIPGESIVGNESFGEEIIDNNQKLAILNNKLPNTFNIKNQIGSSRYSETFSRLAQLENKLIEQSSIFKENSQVIQNLKNKIKTIKASIDRPSEVLLKYRRLKNLALKDEQLLFSMKDELRKLELEKAKQKEPWELISIPTIREGAITPSKKRILALGIAAGLTGSVLGATLKDRLDGVINSPTYLKSFLPGKELITLYSKYKVDWPLQINLLISNFKNQDTLENLVLIPVGEINDEELEEIQKNFKSNDNLKNTKLIKKIDDSIRSKNSILIVKNGFITMIKYQILLEEISLLKTNVIGWIYINQDYLL